jgi:hypothetical protein
MKLSAPIYHLKRQARILSRDENIPLHEALDRLAAREVLAAGAYSPPRQPPPRPQRNSTLSSNRAISC